MKIAKVFFMTSKPLPYPTEGVIEFGPFFPASKANELSPYMLIEIPLQRKVLPILVILPQHKGAIYYSMQFLDMSKATEKGTLPDINGIPPGALLPEHGIILQEPPIWIRLMLKQAKIFWEPLTTKLGASKIAPILHTLTLEERKDLLGDKRTLISKISQENIFICCRWPIWAKHEWTFDECSNDAKRHQLDLTPDNIRKRAARLGLPNLKAMVKL